MSVSAKEEPLLLAWKSAQGSELLHLSTNSVLAREPLPSELKAPLGSLWKLFVYAWLVDTGAKEPAYSCTGQSKDEVYCCTAGGQINRDQALVKSCGLYFQPQRLGLQADQWRDYWQERQAPAWLLDLNQLKPQTRVSVNQLLDTLAVLPAQEQARKVLLDVVLRASDGEVVGALGSRLRVKTWSWLGDQDSQSRQGGFAGWLVDGTPVWAKGVGTSQMVLRHYADSLSQVLPTPWPVDTHRCVEVNLFSGYPLLQVTQQGRPAKAGVLQGDYRVAFANGNQLDITSDGEIFLLRDNPVPQLVARLDREEYVARVLQREARSEPVEAAKALAIAIRTYLLQNARRDHECLSIDDSSSKQRVAPHSASRTARSVAAWTSDLVLAGSPVTYHSDTAGPDKMSWRQAVEQAKSGLRYDAILLHAYPQASLSRWGNPWVSCEPLRSAQDWLQKQRRKWRQTLAQEAGYNDVTHFAVCHLTSGRPYVDRQRLRIYARGVQTLQERLDLAHEYLHLAFDAHPNGQDEVYIEGLARRLLLDRL